MSLTNMLDIAGSGMSAQTIRLNTIASNMANSNSVAGSEKDVYKAKMPVFSSVMQQQTLNGRPFGEAKVGVEVKEITESTKKVETKYQPDHPSANKDGYIFMSNVNTIEEMSNMISASRDYQMNVEMMNTGKGLIMDAIRTLER